MLFEKFTRSSIFTTLLLSLASIKAVSAEVPPAPILSDEELLTKSLGIRDEEAKVMTGTQVLINFSYPKNTKVLGLTIQPQPEGWTNVTFEFDFDQRGKYTAGKDGWLTQLFNWEYYEVSEPPKEVLDDADLLFRYECWLQTSTQNPSAEPHMLDLNFQPPYVHIKGAETWDQVRNEVNIICPNANCVKDGGCGNAQVPEWDEDESMLEIAKVANTK